MLRSCGRCSNWKAVLFTQHIEVDIVPAVQVVAKSQSPQASLALSSEHHELIAEMQPPYQPSPFITAKQLNAHLSKQVVVAGKVVSANSGTLVLDAGDGDKINVHRGTHQGIAVEPGMNVMIRGLVNPDLSVAESNAFPFTDMGEKFDLNLYNEAASVTTHINHAHMFGS